MKASVTSNKYQIMPEMTDEQFQELKEDIHQKGVLQPIEFDETGNIIDGHHRFKAFSELVDEGVDIPMFDKITRKFDSEEAKLDYVISFNVKRRQLTQEQRAELAAKLRKDFGYTLERIGQLLGVGTVTVWRDLKSLPPEEQAELEKVVVTSRDNRVMPTSYAPRIYVTGTTALRDMQRDAISEIAKNLREMDGSTLSHNENGELKDELYHNTVDPMGEAPQPEWEATYNVFTTITPDRANTEPESPESVAKYQQNKLVAFAWYGGKLSHLSWLLPLLPACKHFVDVFGGSAAVLLNRVPAPVETYNDIDNAVVNFFRVLREHPAELVKLLYLTPFSREEKRIAFDSRDDSTIDPIERARRFFVLARQSRSGLAQKTRGMRNSWKFTRDGIQNSMAEYNVQWQSGIDDLAAVADRLRSVQIESYPALRVLELYDTPETLFYCDPPYTHDSRHKDDVSAYANEMTDQDHKELAAKLHTIKGRVAVSGYPSDLYSELYKGWHRIVMPVTATAGNRKGVSDSRAADRVECLWTNYPLVRNSPTASQESPK